MRAVPKFEIVYFFDSLAIAARTTGEAYTAYKKAGMPKVTAAKKVEFAEALLWAGVLDLNRSSSRIFKEIGRAHV